MNGDAEEGHREVLRSCGQMEQSAARGLEITGLKFVGHPVNGGLDHAGPLKPRQPRQMTTGDRRSTESSVRFVRPAGRHVSSVCSKTARRRRVPISISLAGRSDGSSLLYRCALGHRRLLADFRCKTQGLAGFAVMGCWGCSIVLHFVFRKQASLCQRRCRGPQCCRCPEGVTFRAVACLCVGA